MNLRSTACEALASQDLTDTLRGMLSKFVMDRRFPLTVRRYAIDGLAALMTLPRCTRWKKWPGGRTMPSGPTQSSHWPR